MSLSTVLLFIASMIALGFADFATKQTSGRISPALAMLIYAATATGLGLIWTLWSRVQAPLLMSRAGGMWATLTGLSFGIFAAILFVLFSQGVNLSVGTPIIRLGGIAFASFLGIVVLREGFNLQSLAGMVLAAVGILLIATR